MPGRLKIKAGAHAGRLKSGFRHPSESFCALVLERHQTRSCVKGLELYLMWPFGKDRESSPRARRAWATTPVREDAFLGCILRPTSRLGSVFFGLLLVVLVNGFGFVESDGPSNDRFANGGARQAAPMEHRLGTPRLHGVPATIGSGVFKTADGGEELDDNQFRSRQIRWSTLAISPFDQCNGLCRNP